MLSFILYIVDGAGPSGRAV